MSIIPWWGRLCILLNKKGAEDFCGHVAPAAQYQERTKWFFPNYVRNTFATSPGADHHQTQELCGEGKGVGEGSIYVSTSLVTNRPEGAVSGDAPTPII